MTLSGGIKISSGEMYPIGELWFDLAERRLFHGQTEVTLRPKALDVFLYLVEHRGHLVSKSELIEAVWPNSFVTENSLTQCLTEVRRVLGTRKRHMIKTFSRRGYLLEAEGSASSRAAAELPKVHADKGLDTEGQQKSDVANMAEEVQSGPGSMVPSLWQKKFCLYLEVCQTASTICNYEPPDPKRSSAEKAFWLLYCGPLALLADEFYVTPALEAFAAAIEREAPPELLRKLSLNIALNCRKSLNLTAYMDDGL
jgi:DNA-binding winged helix-turn-helix (wHTH) protein